MSDPLRMECNPNEIKEVGLSEPRHLFRLNVIYSCVCVCGTEAVRCKPLPDEKKTKRLVYMMMVHVALPGLYADLYKCKV